MRNFLTCLAVVAFCAAPVFAQGTQVPFGGLEHDASLPVEVSANKLEVDQKDGSAVFTGDVVVGQGQMRLSAERVRIEYAAAGGDATGRVERMHATGNVVLVNGAEAVEAQEAIYTIQSANIVMTGGVILTQGRNALSGDRFVVNLNTGSGVMEGRVRTILQPGASK